MPQDAKYFDQFIATHEDFPKPGISFKDMFPLLANPEAFANLIEKFVEMVADFKPDVIIGLESRGFLLGTPLALKLDIPFVPIRKKGKLPGELERVEYSLEYGTDIMEIQKSAVNLMSGKKILIVDDLLATGGTLNAACQLVNQICPDSQIASLLLIELDFLKGRNRVDKYGQVFSLLHY